MSVSSPPNEWPTIAGFFFRPEMSSSKWSATCLTVLPANTPRLCVMSARSASTTAPPAKPVRAHHGSSAREARITAGKNASTHRAALALG